jgi:hypothetical protein
MQRQSYRAAFDPGIDPRHEFLEQRARKADWR